MRGAALSSATAAKDYDFPLLRLVATIDATEGEAPGLRPADQASVALAAAAVTALQGEGKGGGGSDIIATKSGTKSETGINSDSES